MRRGPLLMILAAASFTAMIGFVKVARQELPAPEVIAYRAMLAMPVVWLWARKRGFRIVRRPVLFARIVFGFGAMFCYYTAAKGLSVADLSLITKLQPILVALLAPLLLGRSERSSAGTWLALVAGLGGCAILLAPQLDVGLEFGLWALAAAGLSAVAHVCLRKLGQTEDPVTIVFWFQVGLALLAGVATVITVGGLPPLPPARLWPILLGCALSAAGGQLLLTMAYRADPAPVVAAAAYTGPVWAVLADLAFFGGPPSRQAWLGGALIVAAGLWLLLQRRDDPAVVAAPRYPHPP